MMLRSIALIAFSLLFARDAAACRFEPLSSEAAFEKSGTAFIGTVRSIENNTVTWTVEKAIKGVAENAPVTSQTGGESCDIRFAAGQQWLFLGSTHPSGSLLLRDEKGNEIAANIAVAEKLRQQDAGIYGGTMERSCAPWDGEAHMFKLDNGIMATIYAPVAPLEQKHEREPASFPLDGKQERGHGHMVRCPKLKEGETSNIPCASLQGTLNLGPIDSLEAAGSIDITGDGKTTPVRFKVKRIHKQVFCG